MNFIRKYWRIFLLGGILSLAAIYMIGKQINLQELGRALSQAQYGYVVPSAILVLLGLAARAVRWRVLLNHVLPLWRSFNIINVTYLINGLVPFRLGELARAFLASRAKPPVPMFTSFSTIIVERLLDTLAVLVILGLALTVAPIPPELQTAAAAFAPLVIIGFAILIIMALNPKRSANLAARIVPAAITDRWNIVEWLRQFLDGLKPLTHIGTLLPILFWTTIAWALSIASGYVLMIAFFGQGNWAATCLFTAAASFAVAVPAVPGNVGPYEASIVLSLQAMNPGGSYETMVAFAIAIHALNLGMSTVLGVFGFIQEGISLEQLSEGIRGMRQQESAAG